MNIPPRKPSLLARGLTGFCRSAAFVLCLVLPLSVAVAQEGSGSVGGKVTDNTTGANLAGAIVSVVGTSIETATDRGGTFYLPSVPAGSQTIRVSYLGMDSKDFPVTVVAGDRATLTAGLGEEVITLQEFTVSSQRTGQAAALNQQRASESLRTIVSADAAGRFPDRNAGESMSRISGVALQRDQGEGRFITVRGVDPDLNNTKINGVVMPASEDDTRKVNLDTVSSDLIESVEVNKAVTPDMDADAIGGSVNVTTTTGFSRPGRSIRGSVEGNYNHRGDDWGHKYAITVADQFGDDKWAYLVSYNYSVRPFSSLGHETDDDPWFRSGADTDGDGFGDGFYEPRSDFQVREYEIVRKRSGLNTSLDFRPTPDDSFYIRGIYNLFSDTEHRWRTRFRSDEDVFDEDDGTFIIDNENITPTSDHSGTASGRVQVDLKDRTEDTSVTTVMIGGEHQRGSTSFDYQAAYAYADLKDPFRRQPVFRSGSRDFTYDFSDPNVPYYDGEALATPLSGFAFREEEREIRSKNSEYEVSGQVNVKHDFTIAGNESYVKTGAKYRGKRKNVDFNADQYGSGGPTLALFPRDAEQGQRFRWTINQLLWENWYRNPSNNETLNFDQEKTTISSLAEDYRSEENVLAAYLMGSTKIDKLQVIAGVRYERTEFSTSGYVAAYSLLDDDDNVIRPAFATPVSADRDYDNLMPSVVLRYDFAKNLIARASWTNTLARPKFTDAAFKVAVEDEEAEVGNPELDPYEAVNWDVSLEYYPRSLGVISVGAFRKEIKNFVFYRTLDLSGDPLGLGSSVTSAKIAENGDTAVIQGVEFDWQMQFTMLPEPFDGFGFALNYTLSDSEADYGELPHQQNLPFLFHSDKIGNFAISYEKYGFFVRVAANYVSANSDVLGVGDKEGRLWDQRIQDHFQIDASANYKINKNLTVFVEGTNLNDEPYESRFSVSNGLRKAEYYGWSANVGIKFDY